ncbi:hypothetical protein [Salarchaeum sp. JOR-1]|uniref:hypothetical protein n=1 Tax=Salarchaeum sp. JOR-1 TaxID=2599399 RepID=UPI00119866B8|nr:hypothetical protein [Salarchaeum sp. JOR-1]QDX39604.1 hypothetical protein FQU85_01370 [Salarchaeum sp. JOR-1]
MPECAYITVLALGGPQNSVRQYAESADHDVHTGTLNDVDDSVDVLVLDDTTDCSPHRVLEHIREHGYDCGVLLLGDRDETTRGVDITLPADASTEEIRTGVVRVARRVAYEAVLDDLFDLCERRADLLDDGDEDALDAVSDRIRERRECTDDIAARFDEADYRAAFRDLD